MGSQIVKKHNTYQRLDGVVLGWERGAVGEGHKVSIIENDGTISAFRWRSPKDPTAGDQVTAVLPQEGVTAKPDRPIILLNQTTGDTHVEVNAHDPEGARKIMRYLAIWVLVAAIIGAGLMSYASLTQAKIILLATTALVVWRMAIATSDLKADERAARRKLDEEEVRSETLLSAWEANTESRLPRIANVGGLEENLSQSMA